jgi:hypothetical protein
MRIPSVVLGLLAALAIAVPSAFAAKKPTAAEETAKLKAEIDNLKAEIAFVRDKLAGLERTLGPVLAEAEAKARQRALRPRFEERSEADKKVYTQAQLDEAWRLHLNYRDPAVGWGSKQARKDQAAVIKKVPKANVAGCALVYLAQMAEGDEQTAYLEQAIREYGDCFYGDGVQVGAFARYLLAQAYLEKGDKGQADRLFAEIRSQFPGAIDHNGDFLATDEP